MKSNLEKVLDYHTATKHRFDGYARGPGRMDWVTQPEQFRRYSGSPLISLDIERPTREPTYDRVLGKQGTINPATVDKYSISRFLLDSMGLAAWKTAHGVSWALRINPSSGNLHPTECYLLCGSVKELSAAPMVCHYAPKEHSLEVRAEISRETWNKLTEELPKDSILIGLTSIHWRESWKYGERAYRYCQLDVGHALAALSLSAAALGWEARLVEKPGRDELALLLGVAGQTGYNAEEPDCLLAMYPNGGKDKAGSINLDALQEFENLRWQGTANSLSPSADHWKRIDEVASATRKPRQQEEYAEQFEGMVEPSYQLYSGSFREIIRQRRSAVAMDGDSTMPADKFYQVLERTVRRPNTPPFNIITWPSSINLALFVHRVEGLLPGLYLLLRTGKQREELEQRFDAEFLWQKPESCPESLDLYLVAAGDARDAAMKISCFQDIASEGCFSLGMLAEFSALLAEKGPWFYPRLFWECGIIGQVLYLEAEAAGLRGTGIGCYFDDAMHDLLGLRDDSCQDLYHFTVGGPVEDPRITTLPAYPDK